LTISAGFSVSHFLALFHSFLSCPASSIGFPLIFLIECFVQF
jgi:hypothetical protein